MQRSAFFELVRLGVVPDELVHCLRVQASNVAAAEFKKERAVLLPRLQALEEKFVALADECDAYIDYEPWRYCGSRFQMSPQVPAWLREQATAFKAFIRVAQSPSRTRRSQGDVYLLEALKDARIVTGQFQDERFARLLEGIPGVPEPTADNFRRWRARESHRWRVKTPSDATSRTRPASRQAG